MGPAGPRRSRAERRSTRRPAHRSAPPDDGSTGDRVRRPTTTRRRRPWRRTLRTPADPRGTARWLPRTSCTARASPRACNLRGAKFHGTLRPRAERPPRHARWGQGRLPGGSDHGRPRCRSSRRRLRRWVRRRWSTPRAPRRGPLASRGPRPRWVSRGGDADQLVVLAAEPESGGDVTQHLVRIQLVVVEQCTHVHRADAEVGDNAEVPRGSWSSSSSGSGSSRWAITARAIGQSLAAVTSESRMLVRAPRTRTIRKKSSSIETSPRDPASPG